jgi:hypothetical protein
LGQIMVIRIGHLGRHQQAVKHRVRNVGHLLGLPKVLMHYLAEDRIGIRPKGASGTRRSARPLTGWREGMLIARTRKRRENANSCFQDSGCLKFTSSVTRRRQRTPSLKHCIAMRSGVWRTNSSAMFGR